jgi:hypothetical protein
LKELCQRKVGVNAVYKMQSRFDGGGCGDVGRVPGIWHDAELLDKYTNHRLGRHGGGAVRSPITQDTGMVLDGN